ncbi:MAG: Ldh family oxidoreductase [Chloroflexi bacterium]|nr:Ldh family oxidoreductase [Chloroflexota bacterium]
MLERFKVPEEDRVYIRPEQMRVATEIVFKNSGLSDEDAGLSTDVLMLSDMRGCETHGVSNMLRRYVEWYDDGLLNPTPNMKIIRESDATATLDADNGLGLHIAPKAMEIAIEKAEKYGMGSVAVSGNNNCHVGMLAYHSMMALEHDMIGVTLIAGDALSAVPTFGAEKRFATNPWAYAVPARDMPPFVFDIATTQVAGNKLALAKRVGAPLEDHWIANIDGSSMVGNPQLPDDRSQYHQLPMGGTREQGSHKGYGFMAVAEILSQILSGAGAAFLNPGTMCHWFCAYKIDAFTDPEKFKDDMDDFLNGLATTPPAPGHDRVLYPGLPEHEETLLREKEGIPYHREVIDWFRSISDARNLGIDLG